MSERTKRRALNAWTRRLFRTNGWLHSKPRRGTRHGYEVRFSGSRVAMYNCAVGLSYDGIRVGKPFRKSANCYVLTVYGKAAYEAFARVAKGRKQAKGTRRRR